MFLQKYCTKLNNFMYSVIFYVGASFKCKPQLIMHYIFLQTQL